MGAMSIGTGRLERVVASRLPRERLARARSLSIVEGAFARVFMACTTGTVLTGFALWLGASPFDIGLLTALPAFAGLAQLLAPYFTERSGQRKPLIMSTVSGQRLLWLPVALLPFLALPPAGRVALLLLLVTVSAMLGALGGVPWLSWMGDLVPKDMRGRYFGARNLVLGAVALVMAPLLGVFLDLWKGLDGHRQLLRLCHRLRGRGRVRRDLPLGPAAHHGAAHGAAVRASRSGTSFACPGRTTTFAGSSSSAATTSSW